VAEQNFIQEVRYQLSNTAVVVSVLARTTSGALRETQRINRVEPPNEDDKFLLVRPDQATSAVELVQTTCARVGQFVRDLNERGKAAG